MAISKRVKKVCQVGVVIAGALGLYGYNESGQKIGPASPDAPMSINGNPLRFSKAGLELIGNAEGCRQDPYKCPADVWTVGVGSTAGVKMNGTYTMHDITVRFATDTMEAQNCLEKWVENRTKRKLSQGDFDAWGSFVFNMGCAKFRSYPVYRLLIEGKNAEACARLPLYNQGGGKVLPGLITRRGAEYKFCAK